MSVLKLMQRLPAWTWAQHYQRQQAVQDGMAAVIVSLMLVPQALAYAVLAGLPPQVGLYASLLPLLVYALMGTSSTLAVGPVAVAALMTASAIAPYAAQDPALGIQAALMLAALAGAMLCVAGVLRLGFLAHFLSHPVMAGFMAAASLLIAGSQLPALLGLSATALATGNGWLRLPEALLHSQGVTAVLSLLTLLLLVLARNQGRHWLQRLGLSAAQALLLCRALPAMLVVAGILLVREGGAWLHGVPVLGQVPAGLPALTWPQGSLPMWQALSLPAAMIAVVGYVESISVAQHLAMKRRERIDPDQELLALGGANLAASLTGGQPVAGGVSRSVVNMEAGAQTPAAGLFTAIGMALATWVLAPWLGALPRFILAATIVVAVLGAVDFGVFAETWRRNRHDFLALLTTFMVTLLVNVETGITIGVMLSIAMHLYRSSRPHIAEVGQVPGTQHFRNIARHQVEVCPDVVTLRVDESLYFANARYLEQRVYQVLAEHPQLKHLILMCSAVNTLDSSALEVLMTLNSHLARLGVGFHLSEVKGPVMDTLQHSLLPQQLHGQIFLSQYQAYAALACIRQSA